MNAHAQRAHEAIITSVWRQNDVVWRHNDAIIASWAPLGVEAMKNELQYASF